MVFEENQVGDQDDINAKNPVKIDTTTDKKLWRDLTAYWILGLCNNYGYVVMLSAAYDIIARFGAHDEPTASVEPSPETGRVCNIISTGAILLADVIPSLSIKAIVPFLPFYIHVRVFIAILLQLAGFLLVAYANSDWMAILGVILTSLSSGLGEASFLSYTAYFHKNVVSTWSSGTGGAGIIGSLSYAGLISIGVSPIDTMLIMLSIPILEGVAFWLILRKPIRLSSKPITIESVQSIEDSINTLTTTTSSDNIKNLDIVEARNELSKDEKPLIGLKNKIIYASSLLKYIVPLTLVYLLEYFINQGLFELVYFPDIWLDKRSQYRWLQVDYQIGVFISRSSVNFITIDKIWLMAVFQFFNVVIFLFEVIYFYMPSIWVVFAFVFWEGLLGGGAYVNTFYRMSKEVPPNRRQFALGIVPLGDSIGIALAGALAIPAHNALCLLPVVR